MPSDQAAIKLDGVVPLKEFQIAVDSFTKLIEELTLEIVGRGIINWEISQLEHGSALFGVKAISHNLEATNRIIEAYDVVGESIANSRPIPFSDGVERAANELVGIINGHIKSVIFITENAERVITSAPIAPKPSKSLYSIGSIRGEIRTVTKNRGIYFSLYDSIFGRAVKCYAGSEYEDILREYWGKRAIVSGTVQRDPVTGRPEEIREIFDLRLDETTTVGDYRRVVGLLPSGPNDPPSEEIIRRIRNG
jgi:hypothetical protein